MADEPALEQRTTARAKRGLCSYHTSGFRLVEKLFIPGLIMMVLPSLLGSLLSPLVILGLMGIGFVCAAIALFIFMTGRQGRDQCGGR